MGSPALNNSPVVSYNSPTAAAVALGDQSANQMVASDALQTGAAGRASVGSIWSSNQRLSNNADMIVLMDSDLNVDRSRVASRDGNNCGRLSFDASGYIHAYGWSLRASSIKGIGSDLSPTIQGGTSSYVANDSSSNLPSSGNDSIGLGTKLAALQVPIPQYCRPLTGDSLGMKIWCATAIDLSGGDLSKNKPSRPVQFDLSPSNHDTSSISRDPDTSGSLVNISSSTPVKPTSQQALRELEKEISQALNIEQINEGDNVSSRRSILKSDTVLNALPYGDDFEDLSSCVWICSTQHSRSKITIIDIKTKPNELLDSFYVPTFLYCIKSAPGCKQSDLLGLPTANTRTPDKPSTSSEKTVRGSASMTLNIINELISTQRDDFYKLVQVDPKAEKRLKRVRQEAGRALQERSAEQTCPDSEQNQATKGDISDSNEDDAEISRILDNNVSVGMSTLQKLNDFVAHTQPQDVAQEVVAEDDDIRVKNDVQGSPKNDDCKDAIYYQPISTHLSTVWMGGKDSVLYIHSAIGQWKDCVACVELQDSILQICHHRGRVFVALADGSLCVFFRNVDTKQWEFSQYLLINIGLLNSATSDSLDLHASNAGSGNDSGGTPTLDIDFNSRLTNIFIEEKNSNDDVAESSQYRDSTPNTTTPEQPKRTEKVSGVHCLEIANNNLWLGYRNRVFVFDPITMKLKHTFNVVPQVDNQIRQLVSMKDGVFICLRSDLTLRLYSSLRPYQHIQNIDIEPVVTRLISPKTFVISHITAMRVVDSTLWIGIAHGIILTIPCKWVPQISEAPLRNSPTGNFEEVPSHLSIARFVPKCDINNAQISFHGHRDAVKFFVYAHNLMLSGGQGYLDFRIDMDDQSKAISDKSHLILWQVPS